MYRTAKNVAGFVRNIGNLWKKKLEGTFVTDRDISQFFKLFRSARKAPNLANKIRIYGESLGHSYVQSKWFLHRSTGRAVLYNMENTCSIRMLNKAYPDIPWLPNTARLSIRK